MRIESDPPRPWLALIVFFAAVAAGPFLRVGYLSRISREDVEGQRQSPTIRGLIRLSAGETMQPARLAELKGRGPRFVERTHMGYVVIHARRTSPALRRFAIDAFRLIKVAERDGHELWVPALARTATEGPNPIAPR